MITCTERWSGPYVLIMVNPCLRCASAPQEFVGRK
jgi:hypothetical protein